MARAARKTGLELGLHIAGLAWTNPTTARLRGGVIAASGEIGGRVPAPTLARAEVWSFGGAATVALVALGVAPVARPTGLIDPEVIVRPATTQVDDLMGEIKKRIEVGERVLVTTLTKRMSEDLTDFLAENGIKEIGRASCRERV